jgi:cation:H+ antiporter
MAALKMGAVDMAIGNLFGSNIFNILILGIEDIFYTQGPLLSFVSHTHLVPVLTAIMMTAVAIIGLTYRAERKQLIIAWDSVVIVLLYLTNLLLLYIMR